MALVKRVASAYLFDSGNLAAFDTSGQQISELQGSYSIDKHKRILLEATETCEYKGFEILPDGFHKVATDWATFFIAKNLNWEEIKNL